MIYVGSAENQEYDQVLDSILVGPIPIGLNKFVFTASTLDRFLIVLMFLTGCIL